MEKQKKPVIGVCPLYDETKESIWMLPGYLEGLRRRVRFPLSCRLQQKGRITKRLTHR